MARLVLLVAATGVVLCAANTAAASSPVLVNELMASNGTRLADPQGDYDDWIELYNAGSASINIAGMYLTDDPAEATKWRVPADRPALTTIPPRGYVIVWADNDTAGVGLHASFQLDADGDRICLFDTDGITLVDQIVFDKQIRDISYGRSPDGAETWGFQQSATPGAANAGAYEDAVAETEFSHQRGFYDAPFDVTITCETPGATIYYTLDGSEPYSQGKPAPSGLTYMGAVPISTTTCLRACAAKPGCLPGAIVTHTYIFPEDVRHQATNPATGQQVVPPGYPAVWPRGNQTGQVAGDYQVDPDVVGANGKDKFEGLYAKTFAGDLKSVPTVSVVMRRDDWFGSTGIYINQSQDGTERVCSLEWIDPNGGGFQANCAIAMQGGIDGGGTSLDRWKVFKLSMRPRFKTTTDDGKPTGGPGEFDYPIFPDTPYRRFNTFVLDEVMTNAWNHPDQHSHGTYIQDQYVSDLHNAMGGQSPHGRYVHLYINGLYWGMYYVHERPDDAWAAQTFGGDKEEYDAVKHSKGTIVNDGLGITGGATANFDAMLNAANQVGADPTNAATYDALYRVLDIDNFITNILARWYATNWDWPNKNWYATHRAPDGLWRFHTWDAEHTMEWFNSQQNVFGMSEYDIHNKLKANAEYRMRFADQAHRQFFNGGPLTVATATSMYRARMAEIDRAIVGESARWGDTRQATPHTREDWLANQNKILSQFIPSRSITLLDYLRDQGLYPSVEAPVFHIDATYQHGGHVTAQHQLSMHTGSGAIWYTLDGSDPRVPGATGTAGETGRLTLVPENAPKRVLVPTAAISNGWRNDPTFNDSAWTSGAGGVGYDTDDMRYRNYIAIDVQNLMRSRNTTCYIRVPFTLATQDLADITDLTLRVRYDDGFVAYLNGTEVQRDRFTGVPMWNSKATGTHPENEAVTLTPFDLTSHIGRLRAGTNLLAVQGLNESLSSSDFLVSLELVGERETVGAPPADVTPTAIRYSGPITLAGSARVKSRTRDENGTWSALNEAIFAVGPVAENLRISEIMYHPANGGGTSDPNTEYVELVNIGDQTIELNLVRLAGGIDFTFPPFSLTPGAYCLVVKDATAFANEYGSEQPVTGQYTDWLDNAGEPIQLLDAAGTVIQGFRFADDWYDITDGRGFSLTARDPRSAGPGDEGDRSFWRPSARFGGSPGEDDSDLVPSLGAVVINELLANSQGSGPDWIELHNTADQTISLGGWFLSDDNDNLMRYEIAADTSIAPGEYIVFSQDAHFGNINDPGCHEPFGLSADGETVYLHSGSGGEMTGYSEQAQFGASEPGVSLGRRAGCVGTCPLVALSRPTPGQANAGPWEDSLAASNAVRHLDAAGHVEEW